MNKRYSLSIGAITCLVTAIYCIYYLLLKDSRWLSISSVLSSIEHWFRHWHVLVVGLLPIYVAFMIFGTLFLGIFLGNTIQHWLSDLFHHK